MHRMPRLAAIAACGIIMLTGCVQSTSPPSEEPVEPTESADVVPSQSAFEPAGDWPRSVPVPPGAGLGDSGEGGFTVPAERADFDAYAGVLANLRDSEEILSAEQNAFRRTFAIDGYIVQVEFDEAAGTMTATAE